MKEIIEENGYLIYSDDEVKKNEFNDMHLETIFSGIKAIGQSINDDGKAYMLLISFPPSLSFERKMKVKVKKCLFIYHHQLP